MAEHNYTADSIKSLDWKEHIRLRPGMYIGKLGDGSSEDDGIYVLLKEVLDNCIDEFVMGFGKQIDVECDGQNPLRFVILAVVFPGKIARLLIQNQHRCEV